jgi:hypothetical protein
MNMHEYVYLDENKENEQCPIQPAPAEELPEGLIGDEI